MPVASTSSASTSTSSDPAVDLATRLRNFDVEQLLALAELAGGVINKQRNQQQQPQQQQQQHRANDDNRDNVEAVDMDLDSPKQNNPSTSQSNPPSMTNVMNIWDSLLKRTNSRINGTGGGFGNFGSAGGCGPASLANNSGAGMMVAVGGGDGAVTAGGGGGDKNDDGELSPDHLSPPAYDPELVNDKVCILSFWRITNFLMFLALVDRKTQSSRACCRRGEAGC